MPNKASSINECVKDAYRKHSLQVQILPCPQDTFKTLDTMKLRQIMPGVGSMKGTPAPTVSICYFNGRIGFNKPTCEILALGAGRPVAFYQDEEHPTDWYFTKENIPGALKAIAEKSTGNISCNNTILARRILSSLNLHQSQRFYVDPAPVEGKYYKILTNQPIKK